MPTKKPPSHKPEDENPQESVTAVAQAKVSDVTEAAAPAAAEETPVVPKTVVKPDPPKPAKPKLTGTTVVQVKLVGADTAVMGDFQALRNEAFNVRYSDYLVAKEANPKVWAVRFPGESEYRVE